MELDELYDLVKKDLELDDTSLDREAIRTPYLHSKYLKFYEESKLELARIKKDYKKLKLEKVLYYTGRADPEVYKEKPFELKILKNEVDTWLDGDDELENMNLRVEYKDTKVDYLQRTITSITNRSFYIRHVIDWRKFINGIA